MMADDFARDIDDALKLISKETRAAGKGVEPDTISKMIANFLTKTQDAVVDEQIFFNGFNQKVLSTGASGIKFYDFDGDGSNDTFRTVNGEPDFQYSCSWEYNQNYYGTPQTQLNNNPAANNVVGVGTPSGVQGFNVLAVDRIIDHATSTADAGFNFSPSFRSVGGSNGWTYLTDEDGNEVDVRETIVPEMFAEEAKEVKNEDKKENKSTKFLGVEDRIK